MKKTIKIKIGGIVFHIDDDAYSMLQQYLSSLEEYFKAKAEGKEVMEDIESRIAEIFQQKASGQKEVVDQEDVIAMIEILGKAKDIIEEEDYQSSESKQTYSQTGKRLYRDPDNAILGGVCGGLGSYFNTDPIWFRILFLILLLVYGAGLVYIILWIVLPKAETAAQKLEMKGENVTVKNIEKTIKEEFETVKDNLGKIKETESYAHSKDVAHDIFNAIGRILLFILRTILVVIGVVFIIVGFVSLVSFLGALLFSNTLFFADMLDTPRFYLPHILPVFVSHGNVYLVMIALLLTIMIPLIALMYGGIKMVFRLKVKDNAIGLTALIIWLIALSGLASVGIFEGVNYSESARITTTHSLKNLNSDTLYLSMNNEPAIFNNIGFVRFEVDNEGLYRDPETGIIYGKPNLYIERSESGEVELEVLKKSRGRSSQQAWEHARELEYYWDIQDSLLLFNHYFELPEKQRWRAPYLNLTLKIPEGKVIFLDNELIQIIDGIETPEYRRSYELVGKIWKVTEEGLIELDQ